MNLPLTWIQDYFEIDDLQQLCDDLTMSGTKVEAVHTFGHDLHNILVGKIEKIEPHPHADKLHITQTNVGDQIYTIVTGANNLSVGDMVPVALPGSVIAGGVELGTRDFRGVVSFGMLCSIDELGATTADYPEASEDGIYLFDGLTDADLGRQATEVLALKQSVIELELTTNRPDCFSVVGILRELRALGYPQKKDIITDIAVDGVNSLNIEDQLAVEINDPACHRYVARVVTDVSIGPSPQWMRRRLSLSGIRPKNNMVDITNYVMLEYGQPLHAFDRDKVAKNGHGQQAIVVRTAQAGEKLTTLDEVEHALQPGQLVIADTDKALAIAGVMGGAYSAITDDTTAVIFESANFTKESVRTTSKQLGLRTDSSGRYEKGLDPNLANVVMDRCMELVQQLGCGTVAAGSIDNYPTPVIGHTIEADWAAINRLLGTELKDEDMKALLHKLEMPVVGNTVHIPSFRKDMQGNADLAEEIIRIHGFDAIAYTVDHVVSIGRKTESQLIEDLLVDQATAMGLHQIMTYSFENPRVLELLNLPATHPLRHTVNIPNPLGDSSIMSSTTIGNMLTTLANNYGKRNLDVALFDLSKIYLKTDSKPTEQKVFTLGMYNTATKGINAKPAYDFYHVKGMCDQLFEALGIYVDYHATTAEDHLEYLHPGRSASISIAGQNIGWVGQIHPSVAENYAIKMDVYAATLNLSLILPCVNLSRTYTEASKFPAVTRDIAMKISTDTTAAQVQDTILEHASAYLEHLELFDVYQGEQLEAGFKSMAYSLSFRHLERTLQDEDVNPIMEQIVQALETELGASLR